MLLLVSWSAARRKAIAAKQTSGDDEPERRIGAYPYRRFCAVQHVCSDIKYFSLQRK